MKNTKSLSKEAGHKVVAQALVEHTRVVVPKQQFNEFVDMINEKRTEDTIDFGEVVELLYDPAVTNGRGVLRVGEKTYQKGETQ